MEKRRILIVDNNDELRVLLEQALGKLGHEVVAAAERDKALGRDDLDSFDLIISDLTEAEVNGGPLTIKAFKMGAANYLRLPYNRDELREIVEKTLAYKLRYVDDPKLLPHVHEKIEFELPSDLATDEWRARVSAGAGGEARIDQARSFESSLSLSTKHL